MAVKWRMDEMCSDCPFDSKGPGLHLRKSLGLNRWRGILRDLKKWKHFVCHKTTEETGKLVNGHPLVCAGSIEWQAKRGLESDLMQIVTRVAAMKKFESENPP